MKYLSIYLYIVTENHCFVDFSFGREDVGDFYVAIYHFNSIKSLLKYFSHWSEEAIEEDVYFRADFARPAAKKRTKEKLNKIKNKLKTDEDIKNFKELYPKENIR